MSTNEHATEAQKIEDTNTKNPTAKTLNTNVVIIIVATGVVTLFIGSGIGYAIGACHGAQTGMMGVGQNQWNIRNGQSGADGREMGRMNGVFGTVTAVDTGSITVKDEMHGFIVTYKITEDTKVTDGGESAKLSNISTGDLVRVQSSDSTSKVQTATSIELNVTIPRMLDKDD